MMQVTARAVVVEKRMSNGGRVHWNAATDGAAGWKG